MESHNVKTRKTPRGGKKVITKQDEDEEDDEEPSGGGNSWNSPRPWLGIIAILALMAFEYWFISNGFKKPVICDPKDTACDPSMGGWGWPISILVPMAGVMTFLGVLFVSNIFSKKPDLSNGEMRKAITGGIVVTYIFFIMTFLFSSASPVYQLFPQSEAAPSEIQATEPPATEAEATEEATVTEAGSVEMDAVLVQFQETPPPPTEEETAEPAETEAVASPEPIESAEPTEEPAGTEPAAPAEINPTSANVDSIDTPIELAASVVNAFTTLVGIVVGFYFSTRSLDNYNRLQAAKNDPKLLKRMLGEED